MESYKKIRVVGRGSYGEVWLVRHVISSKQYVLKKINMQKSSAKEQRSALQEAKLLSELEHPNIVGYKESFETTGGFLYIAMVFCEGGDLYGKLKEYRESGTFLEEKRVMEWFIQISMALQYLHERQILHRDLKTQNVFLTKNRVIKVGDLGIARVLNNETDMATTFIGTPYYMSPELFANEPYNHKSDVWALGCCAYEMCTLKHAFNAKDINSLVCKVLQGRSPPRPTGYSTELLDMVDSMMLKSAAKRPSVSTLLRSAYVKRHIRLFLQETEKPRRRKKSVADRQLPRPPKDQRSSRPKPNSANSKGRVTPLRVISSAGDARDAKSAPSKKADRTPKMSSPRKLPMKNGDTSTWQMIGTSEINKEPGEITVVERNSERIERGADSSLSSSKRSALGGQSMKSEVEEGGNLSASANYVLDKALDGPCVNPVETPPAKGVATQVNEIVSGLHLSGSGVKRSGVYVREEFVPKHYPEPSVHLPIESRSSAVAKNNDTPSIGDSVDHSMAQCNRSARAKRRAMRAVAESQPLIQLFGESGPPVADPRESLPVKNTPHYQGLEYKPVDSAPENRYSSNTDTRARLQSYGGGDGVTKSASPTGHRRNKSDGFVVNEHSQAPSLVVGTDDCDSTNDSLKTDDGDVTNDSLRTDDGDVTNDSLRTDDGDVNETTNDVELKTLRTLMCTTLQVAPEEAAVYEIREEEEQDVSLSFEDEIDTATVTEHLASFAIKTVTLQSTVVECQPPQDQFNARTRLLRKECKRALGSIKLGICLSIFDNYEDEEMESRLRDNMGDKFDDYIGKLWQIKFLEESAAEERTNERR